MTLRGIQSKQSIQHSTIKNITIIKRPGERLFSVIGNLTTSLVQDSLYILVWIRWPCCSDIHLTVIILFRIIIYRIIYIIISYFL